MTTQSPTQTQTADLTFEVLSIALLQGMVDEARAEMEAAWKAQSVTTVLEGFTYQRAEAATRQAVEAQARYFNLCDILNDLLAAEQPCLHRHTVIDASGHSDEIHETLVCLDCGAEIPDDDII